MTEIERDQYEIDVQRHKLSELVIDTEVIRHTIWLLGEFREHCEQYEEGEDQSKMDIAISSINEMLESYAEMISLQARKIFAAQEALKEKKNGSMVGN